MKVRLDFVTNSSSSSFLLGFKDEDSIEQVLNEKFGYLAPVLTSYVMDSISHEKKMDIEQAKEYVKDELRDEFFYEKWTNEHRDAMRKGGWLDEFEEWTETPGAENEFEKFFAKHWKGEFDEHPDYTVFVAPEFGNECGSEISEDLEREYMPRLREHLVARFSHH